MAARRWLIIDTDAGVDDAFAISMGLKLAHKYNYEIKLITTVFGNCSLDKVVVNVAKTRAACGLSASTGPPMYTGCESPLVASSRLNAEYFHGTDGLGNNSFPQEESGISPEAPHAVDMLLRTVADGNSRGIPVALLTLGPLTNLAKAIEKDKNILLQLDKLVIIGGCGNARGNVYRTTEFNVTADPEAAQFVFSALCEQEVVCTLVSWELTLAYSIPWELYDELLSEEAARRSRLAHFLREICFLSFGADHNRKEISHFSHPGEHFGGAVICDALAIAVALNPEKLVISHEQVNVEVELVGTLTRGQTVVDWGCFDGVFRKKNCDWIQRVDLEVYKDMVREMFSD